VPPSVKPETHFDKMDGSCLYRIRRTVQLMSMYLELESTVLGEYKVLGAYKASPWLIILTARTGLIVDITLVATHYFV